MESTDKNPELMLRCFVGIFFSQKVLNDITHLVKPLLQHYDPRVVRWTKNEYIHLTLRFLGSINLSKLAAVESSLADIAKQQGNFSISVNKLRYFPSSRRPQVLALVTDHSQALHNLVAAMEQEMVRLGFSPERRSFKGHITLARFKSEKLPALPLVESKSLQIQINEFCLMQSQTNTRESAYKLIQKYSLKINC